MSIYSTSVRKTRREAVKGLFEASNPTDVVGKIHEKHRSLKFDLDAILSKLKNRPKTLDEKRFHSCRFTIREELEICRRYLEEGVGCELLARRFGLCPQTICNILETYGIRRVYNDRNLELELLVCEMYKQRKSTYEIGRKLGINHSTAWKMLKRNGLERRNIKEALTRHPRPHYPITDVVPQWFRSLGKDKLKIVVATMLLTDGWLSRHGEIGYSSWNKVLLDIFQDLMFYAFNDTPTYIGLTQVTYYAGGNSYRKPIREYLLNLSPTYKTSKGRNQSIEEYMSQQQPNLKFLPPKDKCLLRVITRLAFSAEGNVTWCFTTTSFGYGLLFSCTHPTLINQWKSIFMPAGLRGIIKRDRGKWSGIAGLRFQMKPTNFFRQHIRFIDGVRIGRRRRSPFAGIEKNELLDRCYTYHEINYGKHKKKEEFVNYVLSGEKHERFSHMLRRT